MLDREFFLGFIKIHILYHASKEAIYGADIAAELARHGYNISPGTLYPTLHRLTREGFEFIPVKEYIQLYEDTRN